MLSRIDLCTFYITPPLWRDYENDSSARRMAIPHAPAWLRAASGHSRATNFKGLVLLGAQYILGVRS